MNDIYDVIIIGGGVNGLTAGCYLQKSGLNVCIVERRDEVGSHCSTEEVTIPGFKHNLHATWIITGSSPCMLDLELENFGLDLVTTEYCYAYPFKDGSATLMHSSDILKTYENWAKFSKNDANKLLQLAGSFLPHIVNLMEVILYKPVSIENYRKSEAILTKVKTIPEGALDMNGFEILNLLFESDKIKTMLASLQWIGGLPPWHRLIGSLGALMVLSLGPAFACHQIRGGSHILPHSLARCFLHYGGTIIHSAEVKKIILENNTAKGIILSEDSAYPIYKLFATKAVISNLTAQPTFFNLIGEENLDKLTAQQIQLFNYDEQVLFGAHYALKEAPQWKVKDVEPGIQNCFMGYLGAENLKQLEDFAMSIINGKTPSEMMFNWFVPSLADKTQAPANFHTCFAWLDVPYNLNQLGGPHKWDEIKEELQNKITEKWTEYAPNFKDSILATFAYTPLDIFRRNPSAVKGNWIGGSVNERQYYFGRPFYATEKYAPPKTAINNFYISNSIWPPGTTFLGAGYNAASVIATELGIREQSWWKHKPLEWLQKNLAKTIKK